MRPPDRKTVPSLRTVFVAAERRIRANRGLGVPQGLANNLEDLQRALEGLTEATAHLLRPVVPHFVLLTPRCPLFLALLPLSITPAHAGGLLGCLRGPVALQFLYFPLGGVTITTIQARHSRPP